MSRRSLKFRLWLAAAASITLALVVAGFALTALFERHVERRVEQQLDDTLNQIIGNLAAAPDGRIRFDLPLADTRFQTPLGGLYWQIEDEDRPTLLRSRSLWDEVLTLPAVRPEPGELHRYRLAGPQGQSLVALERRVVFQPQGEARTLRVAVAIDRADISAASQAFAADILPFIALLGAVLILAAWVQVSVGLAPLDAVRRGVRAIRTGASRRLPASYPDEVVPLVEEVNALLDAQEQAIERARAWTADLAHGLKTPLMVLAADAQRLRSEGHASLAHDLEDLAESMRRRVDRELIRARVRSGAVTPQAGADVAAAVDKLVRTLRRTPRGGELEWEIQATQAATAAILADDLTELLGNLLENAVKWASSRVSVQVAPSEGVCVRVEDDGPGVPEERLDHLGRRGLRLDAGSQGSGLGLAIAQDIVDAYGGGLDFARAASGGLAVIVRLPLKSAEDTRVGDAS